MTGGPAKTLRETAVLGATACVTVGTPHGYVTCGASAPRIATGTCQDHVVAPTPEVDDCATMGFTTCAAPTPDLIDGDPSGGANTHVGASNGGTCLQLTSSAAAAGDAIVLAPLQVKLVRPTQLGADDIACTSDDTAGPGLVTTLPLTTATAQAFVLDASNVPGSIIGTPVMTGTRFSCNNLAEGSLQGTPADEGNVPVDTVTTFTLVCQ